MILPSMQKSPKLFLPLLRSPLPPCSPNDKYLTGHDITGAMPLRRIYVLQTFFELVLFCCKGNFDSQLGKSPPKVISQHIEIKINHILY